MSANRIAALSGVLFLVLAIIGIAVGGGEPPDPSNDSVQEIIDFYTDKGDQLWITAVAEVLAAGAIVFFGAYLRKVFRAAAGKDSVLSSAVLAGATILATGMALDATISITLVEAVDDVEPAAVQALSALFANDFLVFTTGALVLILASGLSILRHGGLPRWMGWAGVVLAVAMVTPAGFVGFLGTILWIAIASVLLAVRDEEPAAV